MPPPEEDASRRDFTINGMFYDPLTEEILDFVNGKQDLEKKIVKAIGNPHQRFIEDRLRMIRAIRYSCRFHFSLDEETKCAIKSHANSLFPSVAIERVWQEFSKMQKFGDFEDFLMKLHEVHLLQTIFPELENINTQTLSERLKPLKLFPKQAPLIAKILELFPSFDAAKTLNLCDELKLSNQDKAFVKYYDKVKAAFLGLSSESQKLDAYEWAYLYAHKDFSLCLSLTLSRLPAEERSSQASSHAEKQNALRSAIERIQSKKPLVSSKDLLCEGIKTWNFHGKTFKRGRKDLYQRKHSRSEKHYT